MTTLEKIGVSASTFISLGIVMGFLVNLTSTIALANDRQARDSVLLQTQTEILQGIVVNQTELVTRVVSLEEIRVQVLYVTEEHLVATVAGKTLQIPAEQLNKDK